MRCPFCRNENPIDTRGLCTRCGAALPGKGDGCAGCGFSNPPGFRFCGQCGSSLASRSDGIDRRAEAETVPPDTHRLAEGVPEPAPRHHAERRQLTILFCDLVGSTRLSRRLDVEDYHALLMDYRTACIDGIERYGGSEVRYVGDGIQAYFGYPHAREDAAERAVMAGLDVVEAVRALGRSPRWREVNVAVRIGIGSGPVITDRLSSLDSVGARQIEALGETPNLAARIQSVAPENAVAIGPGTRRLLGGLFTLADLGEHVMKGIDEPVRVWQVTGGGALDRFEATRSPRTPLVNREQELSVLLQRAASAYAGQGQVVVLSGESGIGKSRTARALHEMIAVRHRVVPLYFQCSPVRVDTALHPVIAYIEAQAGLPGADDAEQKIDRLIKLFERVEERLDMLIPLLAALLEIHGDARYPASRMSWQQQRACLDELLVKHLCRRSRRQPLLLVIEDLHWMDPSSRELLERVVHAVAGMRALMLVTCRPDVLLPWFSQRHVALLALDRLGPDEASTLAGHVAGDHALPPAVLARIIENTDGVPLFVEEVVKTLLESGLLGERGEGHEFERQVPPLSIPATLSDSLMARLDRLGPDRRIAQIGAVIGREFSPELLMAVAPGPEAQVLESLESLVRSGILDRRLVGERAVYAFSHALMQEAAHESLLRSQRQRMHAGVARVLETRFPAVGQTNPELLARHYTESAQPYKAVDYWLLAGQKASSRSADLEAINHLRRGLALLPQDDRGERGKTRQLALLIALGPPLITRLGPGADEVRENYRAALMLCEELPESASHFAAYWGWWRLSKNFREKGDAADKLLTLAERLGDPGLTLEAHHAQWATRFVLGDQRRCLEHVDRGLALYREGDHHDHASIYGGHDAKVCGEGEAALALWLTGHPRSATRRMRQALRTAERLEHVGSRAHAMDYALMLDFCRHDVHGVRRGADALHELATSQRFSDYAARALVFLGWSLGMQGEREAGVQAIRKGMLAQQSSGTTEDFPIFFSMQAEIDLRLGRSREAESILAEAADYAAELQVRLWDSEILRLRAIAVPRHHGADEKSTLGAVEHLWQALRIAARQGARMLERRAAETTLRLLAPTRSGSVPPEALQDTYDAAEAARLCRQARTLLEHRRAERTPP